MKTYDFLQKFLVDKRQPSVLIFEKKSKYFLSLCNKYVNQLFKQYTKTISNVVHFFSCSLHSQTAIVKHKFYVKKALH